MLILLDLLYLLSEDVFAFSTDTKITNIIYAQAVEAARCKISYTKDLSKQDLLYFRILDFSLKKEAKPLLTVFNKTDYDRFKSELTTKIPTSTHVGNTSKSYLARIEGTENKKQMIKIIKEEVMAAGDTTSGQKKLWVLKVMKLFYVTLTSLDFANEDSYLYFVLSTMFKNLLLNDPRNCLIFGETNLKAKSIEVNRYLDDDEKRFSGPKIDFIIKDKKYNLEIMTVEVSGPPQKVNQTHFLEDRNKTAKNLKAMFKHILSRMEVERNSPEKIEERFNWVKNQLQTGMDFMSNCVFIDEAAFHINMKRSMAWSKKGERAVVVVPKTRAKTTTILGAISPYGVVNVRVRRPKVQAASKKRKTVGGSSSSHKKTKGGTVTGHHFNFVASCMDVMDCHPEFKGHYIVMDNAPIHKHKDIQKYIESRGYRCVYLPLYSPELNPIEQLWSVVKSKLKREKLLEEETITMRIQDACNKVLISDLRGFCHYSLSKFEDCLSRKPI